MKLKRIAIVLVIIIVSLTLFSACDLFGDNNDGPCTTHKDANGDNVCDVCRANLYVPPCKNHKDTNHDLKCDVCGADVKCVHEDVDGDYKCDYCGAKVGDPIANDVKVDIYSINDLHGKFLDSDTQPGVDNLTTYLKQKREENDNTILLSAGDMWQGTAESSLTRGALMTDWMNELDFDAMALGNHEFDWGSPYIRNNQEDAEFPFLAINVYEVATEKRAAYCEASIVIECDGIQIGVIGAIGDVYSSISSYMCEDVYFKTGSELTSLVKAESDRLRYEGVDFIVYLLHDSYQSGYDMSLSSGDYVDLVFEGHSHSKYEYKDNYGVYHLQGKAENKAISYASLLFEADGNVVVSVDIVDNYQYSSYDEDPIVDTLMTKYESIVGDPYRILGNNSKIRGDVEVEEKVAELYYNFGIKEWGSKYDIVLGGGFLKTRNPYDLPTGAIDYATLFSLFPFDNEVSLCSVRGYDLRKKFFETNNTDYHIFYGSYGAEIMNDIDDNATYYIVVDSYTSQYAYNNLTVIDTTTVFARDLLAEYISTGAWS